MTQQTFEKDVGIAAGRDAIYNGPVNNWLGAAASARLLVKAQRNALHALVDQIADLRGGTADEAKIAAWRLVHKVAGVGTIDEIPAEQFAQVEAALQAEIAALVKDTCRKKLLRRVFQLAKTPELRKKAEAYCVDHFGLWSFKDLSFEQLQELAPQCHAWAEAGSLCEKPAQAATVVDAVAASGAAGIPQTFAPTGQPQPEMSVEQRLVAAFHAAPPAVQTAVLAALQVSSAGLGYTQQVFHGDVGQAVQGDLRVDGGGVVSGVVKGH